MRAQGVEITVRHQTISDHLACLSEQISYCLDILSWQKHKYDQKRVKFKGGNSEHSVAAINTCTCNYIFAPEFNFKSA